MLQTRVVQLSLFTMTSMMQKMHVSTFLDSMLHPGLGSTAHCMYLLTFGFRYLIVLYYQQQKMLKKLDQKKKEAELQKLRAAVEAREKAKQEQEAKKEPSS